MNLNLFLYLIISAAFTFAVTVIILKKLIPKLKSLKMGQTILDIGPRWHKSKEGTPTMGGLSFLCAITLCVIGFGIYDLICGSGIFGARFYFTYFMAVLFAAIGIWDDYLKIKKKENEGFTAKQKFLLQIAISVIYIVAMKIWAGLTTVMRFPFCGCEVDLGFFYYIIAVILIVGIVNSVNLNDGIDGLSSSVTSIVAIFFIAAGVVCTDISVSILSCAVLGGCLGFLTYNFYPARVFMGDTGSLFLGGVVVGLAFLINNPLIIILVGFVYVCESISDIIQVGYFKLTHKRFFKMAPIHHHFEQCGWSEIKIVCVFSFVTLLCSVLAFFGIRV